MNRNYRLIPKFSAVLLLFAMLQIPVLAIAQEIEEEEDHRGLQRVGNTFESNWLIDNQTVIVPLKNTAQMDIQHRFGVVKNGYKDLWGLYAPSNIRIGLSYVPIDNLQVGAGFSKDRLLWDVNAKYAILTENGKKKSPVSVSYLVNMAIDTREEEYFVENTDRLSYFHQLMVARKVTRDFSVQGSISLSHFNSVNGYVTQDLEIDGEMKNDHLAAGLMWRYKISDAFAFIGSYDQPITKHVRNNPNPNIAIGLEVATVMHAFQVFVGNYKWLVPQYNSVMNNNNFADGAFLIGFNITRLWDFETENMKEMLFKRKNK
ncbi:DUF5777 family beta-barrel protein [Gelidibacter salicanalis]|uniref:DUF5777 domain-containing protein n=1 Tax=Gelidibacter salicanalis TaxID=291193 RepID=A0A934KT16_9FLAO|nr:DUF5777 family beta-barrel protein [Gelidibacter salicanalis]MBJ7880203.1 hypothetical protein [Gelidibacter salicanalis]